MKIIVLLMKRLFYQIMDGQKRERTVKKYVNEL